METSDNLGIGFLNCQKCSSLVYGGGTPQRRTGVEVLTFQKLAKLN